MGQPPLRLPHVTLSTRWSISCLRVAAHDMPGCLPQEMGKKKLERQATDIRVEVPGPRDQVAPCAPKISPVLTPGKASPKKPADAAI